MSKYAIGVILYKPNINVFERINSLLNNGYTVYIYDNTPEISNVQNILGCNINLRYLTKLRNVGIGPAINEMTKKAYDCGEEYFLYFDQDTIFTLETLAFIENTLKLKKLDFNNNLFSLTFRDNVNRNDYIEKVVINNKSAKQVYFTISSGTLFSLKKLKEVGWHDTTYFIDGVDYSICLSAIKHRFKIYEIYNTPGLDHKSEQDDLLYNFFGLHFTGRKYPKIRCKDFSSSSLRLILRSIKISLKATCWLVNHFTVFWIKQVLIIFSTVSVRSKI